MSPVPSTLPATADMKTLAMIPPNHAGGTPTEGDLAQPDVLATIFEEVMVASDSSTAFGAEMPCSTLSTGLLQGVLR